MLKIGDNLSLPLDAVTHTFAVLAQRGVGKSYTASVLAEEMLKAGQPIVALDPTGVWWGLRSKYPVVIFGGEHADVPLEESAGEVIARSIVENRFPAVLDLSLLRKGAMLRFLASFLENFYRLNREPVHLFVDEADVAAPQGRTYGVEEARTLGAMEDIVRRGRKKGIGCSLITQRPAVLSKNVLTQADCLVALRLGHPRDIGAIMEWIEVHADPAKAAEMLQSLPSLNVGTAWFWSPGWGQFFKKVNVRKRETFDSGATPVPGVKTAAPAKMASIDLEALGADIKATVEKVKASDPKVLHARIRQLETELAGKAKAVPDPGEYERGVLDGWTKGSEEARQAALAALRTTLGVFERDILAGTSKVMPTAPSRPSLTALRAPKPSPSVQTPPLPRPDWAGPSANLPKAERLILTALAQHGPSSKAKVAVLTGYAANGGGFGNALGSLRAAGRIDGGVDQLSATPEGLDALGTYEPLPTGSALVQFWTARLPKAERLILAALVAAWPSSLGKEDLAAKTGYAPDGGGFGNALGKLRTLGLIDGQNRGGIRASGDLFDVL